MQVLSLAFDLMFFLSLAFLFVGFAGLEPTAVVGLSGLVVPLCLIYRTGSKRKKTGKKEITCSDCHRSIPADAKICRYCLATVDQQLGAAPSLISSS
jgi:hypothetical protein